MPSTIRTYAILTFGAEHIRERPQMSKNITLHTPNYWALQYEECHNTNLCASRDDLPYKINGQIGDQKGLSRFKCLWSCMSGRTSHSFLALEWFSMYCNHSNEQGVVSTVGPAAVFDCLDFAHATWHMQYRFWSRDGDYIAVPAWLLSSGSTAFSRSCKHVWVLQTPASPANWKSLKADQELISCMRDVHYFVADHNCSTKLKSALQTCKHCIRADNNSIQQPDYRGIA